MSWIEAINLTLNLPEDKGRLYNIIKEIRTLLEDPGDRQAKVSLYQNTRRKTNWAIHLRRESSSVSPGKTGIGKDFADVVGKLGNVEHAVWKKVPGTTSAIE